MDDVFEYCTALFSVQQTFIMLSLSYAVCTSSCLRLRVESVSDTGVVAAIFCLQGDLLVCSGLAIVEEHWSDGKAGSPAQAYRTPLADVAASLGR